jgi:DNA primase
LPQSPGADYLQSRRISLELAQRYGLGYAASGKWMHPARDWKWGRVVFPDTDPNGCLVNLYGRAVGSDESVPKLSRHDHLPGYKGYFNGLALLNGSEQPLFVTESPFGALSLIAAGCPRAVAIFGVDGWRWEWARQVEHLVFATDADAAGQRTWRELARQARLRGKTVGFLPPEAFGGYKDVNEAWMVGVLSLTA